MIYSDIFSAYLNTIIWIMHVFSCTNIPGPEEAV